VRVFWRFLGGPCLGRFGRCGGMAAIRDVQAGDAREGDLRTCVLLRNPRAALATGDAAEALRVAEFAAFRNSWTIAIPRRSATPDGGPPGWNHGQRRRSIEPPMDLDRASISIDRWKTMYAAVSVVQTAVDRVVRYAQHRATRKREAGRVRQAMLGAAGSRAAR